MALADIVAPLLTSFQGEIGLYVRHLETGEEFAHQADAPFLTASVFKIPVLVELFRQVDQGRVTLHQTVTVRNADKRPGTGVLKELSDGHAANIFELATLMIIVSDNTATDLLMELVSKEAIHASLREFGLNQIRVDLTCREILDDLVAPISEGAGDVATAPWRDRQINLRCKALTDLERNDVATPRQMSRLLELIHLGQAASPSSCEAMIDMLKRQQVNDRIPIMLPTGTPVAHKTGELPFIRNDAGIVYSPSGPYLFTAFTRKLPHESLGCREVGDISQAVYDYFCGGVAQ